jgi:hypothetical protein
VQEAPHAPCPADPCPQPEETAMRLDPLSALAFARDVLTAARVVLGVAR